LIIRGLVGIENERPVGYLYPYIFIPNELDGGKMIANESVNRAIDYILNNITKDISVDEVAKHCNFSRYYFSRIFKIATGESIVWNVY